MNGRSLLKRIFEASEAENRAQILRIVRQRGPFPRLLDLGCYDGSFTVELGKAAGASQKVGIEFVKVHAARARARRVDIALGSLDSPLHFPDASFDLVHANQVIEHVKRTDLILSEASRVAKPGGFVLLSTNNLSSWHNIGSLLLGFQPPPIHVSDRTHVGNPLNPRQGQPHVDEGQTHLRLFTGRALTELGEYHGLEVVEHIGTGYYPFPPRLARRLARLDRRHAAFLIAVFRTQPVRASSG